MCDFDYFYIYIIIIIIAIMFITTHTLKQIYLHTFEEKNGKIVCANFFYLRVLILSRFCTFVRMIHP